jgi:hypothetical protein
MKSSVSAADLQCSQLLQQQTLLKSLAPPNLEGHPANHPLVVLRCWAHAAEMLLITIFFPLPVEINL